MVDKNIGKRIRQYRIIRGLTQEKLAEKTGLSVIAISNIERGINYPAFENFISISNALEISSDALLIDVIDKAYLHKSSELSEKLNALPCDKRQQLLTMIEMIISQA